MNEFENADNWSTEKFIGTKWGRCPNCDRKLTALESECGLKRVCNPCKITLTANVQYHKVRSANGFV